MFCTRDKSQTPLRRQHLSSVKKTGLHHAGREEKPFWGQLFNKVDAEEAQIAACSPAQSQRERVQVLYGAQSNCNFPQCGGWEPRSKKMLLHQGTRGAFKFANSQTA